MTAAGLLVTGCQFVVLDEPPQGWADCQCLVWAPSPPQRHCNESRLVLGLPCGVRVELRAYSEPADRLFPQRTITPLALAEFHTGDINLDGAVTRLDWSAWLADRYDYDGDGRLTIADDAAVWTAMMGGCP